MASYHLDVSTVSRGRGQSAVAGAAYRAALRPAIMEEVWSAGSIGPARWAIMDRVQIPYRFLLGRTEDRPCGAAFVAADSSSTLNAF